MTLIRALLSAALLFTCSQVYGQDPSLQQALTDQLKAQYKLAKTGSDASGFVVIEPGVVLVVKKGGILGVPPANVAAAEQTYKDGDLKGVNAFARGILGNAARYFQVGEKVYVRKLDVNLKADKVTFIIFECDTCNGVTDQASYRSVVVFQFPKGYLGTAKPAEVVDVIGQLLAVDTGAGDQTAQVPQAQPPTVVGSYFLARTGSQLQINADGTFVLTASSGAVSPGTYVVRGASLILTYRATGRSGTFTIQGDRLITDMGLAWARQGGAPTTVAPAPAPAPSLALPATYVNSQSKEDTLQLKADHTFSLLVAGQTYQGGFQVDGNTIGLKISADTTTNVTIEGDHINDANGQTWVLQKQQVQ